MSSAVQSTRALSLQQLEAVHEYIHEHTDDCDRTGFAIRRVVEDGFYAEVETRSSDDSETFVVAFSDRAAQRLDDRYDQIIIQLDLNAIQTHEH